MAVTVSAKDAQNGGVRTGPGLLLHMIPADRQHTCHPVSFSVNAALEYCSIEHLIAAEL